MTTEGYFIILYFFIILRFELNDKSRSSISEVHYSHVPIKIRHFYFNVHLIKYYLKIKITVILL